MGRIDDTFERLRSRGEAALIPYLMAGYPSLEVTKELLYAIVSAGADLVELGIPFSDPLADGATLQRASQRALQGDVSLRRVLEMVASVRDRVSVPLVLMSYCNPLLRLGEATFAREAAAAGVDGLIVPDLPVEETGALGRACGDAGVAVVGMVAPTSPDERIETIARGASGFIYCVSLKGVTGARSRLPQGVDHLVDRVRRATTLPAVVGFGISSPDQVRAVTAFADGVVVASALLDRIDREPLRGAQAAGQFVAELKSACRGAAGRPETVVAGNGDAGRG